MKTNYFTETYDDEVFTIFPKFVAEVMDDIRSGDYHKGKFISVYLSKCRDTDYDGHELELKYPQFVSRKSSERWNNWLDIIINLEDDIYQEFKRGLNV